MLNFKFGQKFSLKAEADMLHKLSMYLSANVPLSDALQLLEDQTESRNRKEVFSAWRIAVENGKSLAQAFSDSETVPVVVREVSRYSAELGEKSGSLAACLKEASLQIGKILGIKKKVIGALAYPAAILIGTVGLVLGLMLFIFPKIIPLFETLKAKLPLSTRLLIDLSQFLTEHWFIALLVIVICVSALVLLTKFSKKANMFFDRLFLRIPIVGHVIRAKIICSVFDSLYVLLRGGEQLSEGLLIVSKAAKYAEYTHVLVEAGEKVGEGKSLAEFFRERKKLFPLYIFGIISVGEKSGHMEHSVQDIAEISRNELDDKLRVLTAVLEPLLMVSMSFIIGFIALSIILPIYGITSHFQNV